MLVAQSHIPSACPKMICTEYPFQEGQQLQLSQKSAMLSLVTTKCTAKGVQTSSKALSWHVISSKLPCIKTFAFTFLGIFSVFVCHKRRLVNVSDYILVTYHHRMQPPFRAEDLHRAL